MPASRLTDHQRTLEGFWGLGHKVHRRDWLQPMRTSCGRHVPRRTTEVVLGDLDLEELDDLCRMCWRLP